jgi:hypothetical protein
MCGLAAAVLPLAGFASYIRDTLRGRAQPNRMSWSLWAVAPLIAFGAELAQHVSLDVALLSFALGFGPACVVAASFVNPVAYWQMTNVDLYCGGLSLAALVAWAVTGQGGVALMFAIGADAAAAMPTIVKSWSSPWSESPWTYLATAAGGGFTLLIVKRWTFAEVGFAAYVIAVCAIITALIIVPWRPEGGAGPMRRALARERLL